jgi:hypothetical protein
MPNMTLLGRIRGNLEGSFPEFKFPKETMLRILSAQNISCTNVNAEGKLDKMTA